MQLPQGMTTLETGRGMFISDAKRTDRVISGPFSGEAEAEAWFAALSTADQAFLEELMVEDGEAPLNISTDPRQAALDIVMLRNRR